jgi:hypothetical protein
MQSYKKASGLKTFSLATFCLFFLLTPVPTFSQARTVNAIMDTAKTGAPISPNIYGQFLEH